MNVDKSHDIRNLIIEHIDEKGITIQKLCEIIGCHRSYAIKKFKKDFNTTPYKFLMECRVEKAKNLIENNIEMSLKDVADKCGYKSIFHFSKQFKQVAGYNPSEHCFKSSVYKGNKRTKAQVTGFKYKQLYNDAIKMESKDFRFDINQVNDALKMILEYDGENIPRMQSKISRVQRYVEKGIKHEKNRLYNKQLRA